MVLLEYTQANGAAVTALLFDHTPILPLLLIPLLFIFSSLRFPDFDWLRLVIRHVIKHVWHDLQLLALEITVILLFDLDVDLWL